MQSRKDQVQAYFFVVGRLVSALMRGRPDDKVTPTRRFAMGAIIGTLLGGLVVAGFGVVGLISPGGNESWRTPGSIVVEEETGARYLFADGVLHPVLNYTSAMLAVGGQNAAVSSVSRNSLSGVPRGRTVGIPGAPDSLPDAENLSGDPWTACATTAPDASGAQRPTVDLHVGPRTGDPLGDDDAVLVSTPDDTIYLMWQGKRLRVPNGDILGGLGYGSTRPYRVTAGWLSTVDNGPDLAAPRIPDVGAKGPSIDGAPGRVGTIYEVRNSMVGSDEFYLLRPDGLAPVNRTLASLVLADPANAAVANGGAPRTLSPSALSSAPRSAAQNLADGIPAAPPKLRPITNGSTVRPCAEFDPAAPDQVSTLVIRDRAAAGARGVPPSGGDTGTVADHVDLPAGRAVLARNLPAPGVATGTRYLVSDTGVKYPLPAPEVAGLLGYGGASAVPVPSSLLDLLPTGPPLDPTAAMNTQPAAVAAGDR